MSVLDKLGIKHNTDKASRNRVQDQSLPVGERPPGHNYLIKYEHFLRHLIGKPDMTMLELGAGPDWNLGASAYMWADYFPACKEIHVAEIRASGRKIETDRIHPRIGDLSDPVFLRELGETQWDFILDDASHIWSHQIQALAALIQSVKQGGIYIIEDIQTSFGDLREQYRGRPGPGYWGNVGDDFPDAVRVLSDIAFCVAGSNRFHPVLELSVNKRLARKIGAQLESITFINGSAILVKKSDDNTYLSSGRAEQD